MSSQALPDDIVYSLIRELEAHPCVWQKSHRDYKNSFKKSDAIGEIAFILGLSDEVVKEKIRSLRTIYFQNAQKVKKAKSGSSGGSQPKWKFFNALSYLQSEVADCGAIDNMQLNTSVMKWIRNCDIAHSHHLSFRCSQTDTEAATS